MEELVRRTWEELGFKVRATGFKVWVRTLPHPRKAGNIWLPPKAASFYGEMPHLRLVFGVVLSAGNQGTGRQLCPGDVIAFKRVHFGWIKQLEPSQVDDYGKDEEFLGFLKSAEDIAYIVEETDGWSLKEFDLVRSMFT